jgi:hypothetical protein
MSTNVTPLRSSPHASEFNVGITYSRDFQFFDGQPRIPLDLTQFTGGISMVVYDAQETKIDSFVCTPLTDPEHLTDGVVNKCRAAILPTGASGTYLYEIEGNQGGTRYIIAVPARITYYDTPPLP